MDVSLCSTALSRIRVQTSISTYMEHSSQHVAGMGVRETQQGFSLMHFTYPKCKSVKLLVVVSLNRLNYFTATWQFCMLTAVQVQQVVQLALRPNSWFIALNLQLACWQISGNHRFHKFLAIQVGWDVLQSTMIPFTLRTVQRVSTNLTKVLARVLRLLTYPINQSVQASLVCLV